jgi:hypothetical protein
MNRVFILLKTSFYLRLEVARLDFLALLKRLRVFLLPPAAAEHSIQAAYSGFFVVAVNHALGFGPQFFFGGTGSLDHLLIFV